MSKRPSAALREIHRELDRRRKFAAVAKGRIEKKSSTPPTIPNAATGAVIQKKKSPSPIQHERAIMKTSPRAPAATCGQAPNKCAAPRRRDALTPFAMKVSGVPLQKSPIPHERAGTAMKNKPAETATKKSPAPISRATPPIVTSSADIEPIKEGTKVCVRTPMGTTPSGLRLFIWLSAVVVSDAEDGYFEVLYNGNFPRDDPFRTVRVPRDQVKKMPSPSSRQ
jgi:hypothetical protein